MRSGSVRNVGRYLGRRFRRPRAGFGALLAFALLCTASASNALMVDFTLLPFTGDASEVTIALDDVAAGPGKVQMTVSVSSGFGDIRGIFFDIADDALLAGLNVSGIDVTQFAVGDVINLGGGNNLNGGGTPCPCDVGVEIGTPGMGTDDIMTTTLVIMHDTFAIDATLFSEQSFGARVTSVGVDEQSRTGSSKLAGMAPFIVPEPSTAGLTGLGIALLAWRRRAQPA